MGCWNGTCGLTNLPILSGEKMYVFPVKEEDTSSYRSHCYATALYKPSVMPFVATYNDYGAGEDCEGVALDLIMEGIKKELVEMEVGENQYHDIAVKKEGFDDEVFFEAVHENRLFVRGWGQSKRPVYFTMVRKDVVDRMWTEWKRDIYVGKGNGSNPDDYYERGISFAMMAEQLGDFLDTAYNTTKGTGLGPRFRRDEETEKFLVSRYIRENHEFWDIFFYQFKVFDLMEEGKRDEAIELMTAYLLGQMVNSMMEKTRKIWLPVMHLGSQSQEYNEYKFMNQITNEVIVEREKEYEEYEEDE